MKNFFSWKFNSDIGDFSEYKIFYKKLYVKVLISIGFPVCILIGVFNISRLKFVTGGILFVMVFVLGALIFNTVRRSETKKIFLSDEILIRVFLFLSIIVILYAVGVEQSLSRTIWFLIFPLILFFTTSILEALIWLFFITIFIIALLFSLDLNTSWNEISLFKVKLIVLYIIMVAATFVIALVVQSVMKTLFDKQQDLKNTAKILEKEIEFRKKTTEALQQSEERYRLIADNVADVIWTTDMDFKFKYITPSILQQRGYTVEEALKMPLEEVALPGSLEKIMLLYSEKMELIKKGDTKGWEVETFEAEQYCKDGRKIWTQNYARILPGPDGRPLSILGTSRDITTQKQAEQEKIESQIAVGEHKKMALVGQIAGKMAHDFNNILSIIMGNAELSLMSCRDEEANQVFELIVEQAVRGKNLTKNLVAFAKDQEPKQEFFSINEKIDLVCSLLRKDLEGIKIVKEEGVNIPDLFADSGMIEHALVNLLQNSIHATSLTENPEINLSTDYDGENIFFEIRDNGCGIPEAHLENIYEPSFTLKGSHDGTGSYQSGIKGTGYGMSNVKKYIEQHKGSISVESEQGRSTTFVIRLPVINKELTTEEKTEIQKAENCFEKYILLVEDEQAISDVQYRILTDEPCNHKVDVATNGNDAMDLFDRNQYDLVSLDYILPGDENGMDVYKHIRKANKTIPILFISGNIEFLESIKRLKQKDNYIAHVSKPCRNKEYVSNVNALLKKTDF